MMCNANFLKKGIQLLILASPVSLHGEDLFVELAFDKRLEIGKNLKHLRSIFQKINPSIFAKIINEAYIILIAPNRFGR